MVLDSEQVRPDRVAGQKPRLVHRGLPQPPTQQMFGLHHKFMCAEEPQGALHWRIVYSQGLCQEPQGVTEQQTSHVTRAGRNSLHIKVLPDYAPRIGSRWQGSARRRLALTVLVAVQSAFLPKTGFPGGFFAPTGVILAIGCVNPAPGHGLEVPPTRYDHRPTQVLPGPAYGTRWWRETKPVGHPRHLPEALLREWPVAIPMQDAGWPQRPFPGCFIIGRTGEAIHN